IDRAGYQGYRASKEGSDLIIKRSRAEDPRPLHVLVWGGIEDLAQALHDAPDILPKLRVHWNGGPKKKWSPDAYQYIVNKYPKLHIIETNAAYRGWFVGGNQEGQWSNSAFVEKYVAGKGALGSFFATQLGGEIKMGDTPSVAWLLKGNPEDPSQPSWGGKFVRAWDRPYYQFDKLPSKADSIQEFGIMGLVLPLGTALSATPKESVQVTNESQGCDFPAAGPVRMSCWPNSA